VHPVGRLAAVVLADPGTGTAPLPYQGCKMRGGKEEEKTKEERKKGEKRKKKKSCCVTGSALFVLLSKEIWAVLEYRYWYV